MCVSTASTIWMSKLSNFFRQWREKFQHNFNVHADYIEHVLIVYQQKQLKL